LIRLRYQVLAFTATRTVLNTAHRMVYPFLPAFGRGLGVDLTALSLALAVRSIVGTFGPLLASVADSRGRKAGMLFGLLLFTAGVTQVVFWPTYGGFLLALVLTTLGKYVFDPAMQAYLGDRVTYHRRGFVLAITEVGWSLSFILGVPAAGFSIARQGWMSPFPLLALLGMVSFGFLYWWLPKDPGPADGHPGLWENFRKVLTYKPAIAGLSMGILASAANEVVNLVFGVWMEDSFGLRIAALGAAAALIGLAELGGETLVGGFTDRLGKPRAVAVGLFLNCLAALALPLLGRSAPGALVGLFLFYLTFEFTLVSIIPLMTEVLPAARATLLAANVAGLSLGRATGAFLAPMLYVTGSASGITGSALAAVLLNLCALLALRWLINGVRMLGASRI
jgi:predicted MFS family arabinose efflux permease